MISYTFRPLLKWPRTQTAKRINPDFSVPLDRAWRYLTRELDHLGVTYRSVIESKDTFDAAYRRPVKVLHPDAHAGRTVPEWPQLQQAKEILDRHFSEKGT